MGERKPINLTCDKCGASFEVARPTYESLDYEAEIDGVRGQVVESFYAERCPTEGCVSWPRKARGVTFHPDPR